MGYDWKTCPSSITNRMYNLTSGIKEIIGENFVGLYLHGSLAMGGFNPKSDIDVLVVINKKMEVETKSVLAQYLLNKSNSPYPIEVSFLIKKQLKAWRHPHPYDFHYSESWRERYQFDLEKHTSHFLHKDSNTDADLAAHITITNHRGVCIDGEPIDTVFPSVPPSDYVSSIVGDFQECLENIEDDPVYCSLNLIRVYWYLKEGVISSKEEAGNWGLQTLPQEFASTVKKAVDCYMDIKGMCTFHKDELTSLKNYMEEKVYVFFDI